jgi:hypothetical protein
MSTSTISTKKANSFQLFDSLIVLGLLVASLFLVGAAAIIGFNLGEFHASFWLGLLGPVLIAGVFYTMWWVSHPVTKKWPGVIIGIADLIAWGFAVHYLWPDKTFSLGKFGWGLLDAVILAVLYALIKLYGLLTRKLASKYPSTKSTK